MRAPTTNKVIEFLERYIADNGIPRKFEQIQEQHSQVKNLNNFAKNTLYNT